MKEFEEIEDVEFETEQNDEIQSLDQKEYSVNNDNQTSISDIGEESPITQSGEETSLFYQQLENLRDE